jgi:hypothetical protein
MLTVEISASPTVPFEPLLSVAFALIFVGWDQVGRQ